MTSSLREKLKAFDSALPLHRARTIPAAWYFDSEIYAAECRSVFGGSWQLACRAEQVVEPGSYVTLEIAGEPILVLRGNEPGNPRLRAFFNVCRHRAACVLNEPSGKATRLRCRYHGWTYDLGGKLIGTPEFDGVAQFEREDNGLIPIAVDTWGQWVWINMALHPAPLREFLAPLSQQNSVLELDSLRFAARREYELACNWKVFVDNYLDGGYHVNTVHPGLAGVLDYSQYRTAVHGITAVQISPIVTASRAPNAVSNVRSGATAYYWWCFPNFMLNAYSGVMDTNLVLPLGPDRCRVIFDFYFKNDDSVSPQFIMDSIAVAEQIQQEDIGICAEVQRGLSSQSFTTGRFSVRREAAGYEFHRLLAHYLRQAVD
jgi:choline monooxygenase